MTLPNLNALEAEWAVFMENKTGNRNGWTQDQRWRNDNPGEFAKLVAYRDAGGERPVLTSEPGRRMVFHVDAYLLAKEQVDPEPPPSGAVQLEDSFEVPGTGPAGLRTDWALPINPAGWSRFGVNGSPGNFQVETPPGGAGKGTKALRITTYPDATNGSFTWLSGGTVHRDSRAPGQNGGHEYWGFMIFLPTNWTWGWTGIQPNWGMEMMELKYPPFITPNGPFRVRMDPGGANGDGTGTLRVQIKGGYGNQPRWAFGETTTTYSGSAPYINTPSYPSQTTFPAFGTTALELEPHLKIIPQGEFTKGVWHEIIIHVLWTVGIEQGGVSPVWQTWWRRKGETNWNLTIDLSGADHANPNRAASLLWGIDGNGWKFTPDMYLPDGPPTPTNPATGKPAYDTVLNGVKRMSTYDNLGGFYLSRHATGNHAFWVDNMIVGDSFDAIASRMP